MPRLPKAKALPQSPILTTTTRKTVNIDQEMVATIVALYIEEHYGEGARLSYNNVTFPEIYDGGGAHCVVEWQVEP